MRRPGRLRSPWFREARCGNSPGGGPGSSAVAPNLPLSQAEEEETRSLLSSPSGEQ